MNAKCVDCRCCAVWELRFKWGAVLGRVRQNWWWWWCRILSYRITAYLITLYRYISYHNTIPS